MALSLVQRFYLLDTDTCPVGLIQRQDDEGYFCTPVGAHILVWTGVGGIHYCTIDGFGETVFAVNPERFENHVYLVAESFEKFLGLILSTSSEAAIEQIVDWDRSTFDEYLQKDADYFASEEVKKALMAIASLGIEPVEDPFGYVKKIQENFDYAKIRYTDEYYDVTGIEKPKA